jgi:hypothetical protein
LKIFPKIIIFFKVNQYEVAGLLGSNINLTCSQKKGINWLKSTDQYNEKEEKLFRYGIEKNGDQLLITSLQFKDQGIYKCFRNTSKFYEIKLTVYDPSSIFYYKMYAYLKSEKIFLKLTETAYQVCTVETNADTLTIEWFNSKTGKV